MPETTESAPSVVNDKMSPSIKSVESKINKLSVSEPPLVLRGIVGEVKWFNPFVGYGFITREDNEKDIFVHSSAVVRCGKYHHALTEGDKVEFDVVQGLKGPEAWSVTAPGGKVIQGVRIYRALVRRPPFRGPRKISRDHYEKTKSEENNNRDVHSEKDKVMKTKAVDDYPKENASKGEGQRRMSYKGSKKINRKPKRKDSTSETLTKEVIASA